MKNLKMILSAMAILILSILTGCSDSITSSGGEYVKSSNKGRAPEMQEQISRPLFQTRIRLKPNRSYTFNQSNTGLSSFNSIDVGRIYSNKINSENIDPCGSLVIYGGDKELSKTVSALNCKSVNINVKEITIHNISSAMIDLEVILTGTKSVKNYNDEE